MARRLIEACVPDAEIASDSAVLVHSTVPSVTHEKQSQLQFHDFNPRGTKRLAHQERACITNIPAAKL